MRCTDLLDLCPLDHYAHHTLDPGDIAGAGASGLLSAYSMNVKEKKFLFLPSTRMSVSRDKHKLH